jgi:hypothetical protein
MIRHMNRMAGVDAWAAMKANFAPACTRIAAKPRTRFRKPGYGLFLIFKRKTPPHLTHLVSPGRYHIHRPGRAAEINVGRNGQSGTKTKCEIQDGLPGRRSRLSLLKSSTCFS